MDTNLVLPLGPRTCKVVFDYFLEASLKDDKAFIERSLEDSERVQVQTPSCPMSEINFLANLVPLIHDWFENM